MLERLYDFEDQVFDCVTINYVSFYQASYEVYEGTGLIVNKNKEGEERRIAEMEISNVQHVLVQRQGDVIVIV